MQEAGDEAPKPFVLQGRDFSATGKLANVANVPLCPGASPFIRMVNDDGTHDPNLDLVAETFRSAPSKDIEVRSLVRGRILERPLSLIESAGLLDRLRYARHHPPADGWEGQRWRDLEAKIGISTATDIDGLLPFFRPPAVDATQATPYAQGGPYAIAAYLRAWSACLTHSARGLVATDDPSIPWSLLDLAAKARQQPAFYVGVRYGSGSEVTHGALGELPFRVRAMRRATTDGAIVGAWGTRNPVSGPGQYLGDELFDYHHHHESTPAEAAPGEPLWRPVGAPGLILFHVIEKPGLAPPTVAVGLAIPLGGPDQFAARSARLPT